MKPEWSARLKHWISTLEKEFYEPLGELQLEYFTTYSMLTPQQAQQQTFAPSYNGMKWGKTREYAWFRGKIKANDKAIGKKLVFDLKTGGEATVYINGEEFGTRRAEWVTIPHHYICDQVLTSSATENQVFDLLAEVYAGHDFPTVPSGGVCTGPVRDGDYEPRPENELRHTNEKSTYGIWHEEAYQLWLDVTFLKGVYEIVDDSSLRADEIENALQEFMLNVDFEQPRNMRLTDYIKAREILQPVMNAVNGSTAPEMWAIGNAHLDLSWVWGYRETQRKVARTFAQQLRLTDMYPEYKFIQSQPQSYLICKELYPALYEKVKEKIKSGQWIADGSMWVEPDTNMSSGESLIRQLIHGKRFYKDEFGIDTKLLWLPDTFGYTAALPQILKNCGVDYLTTQKISWTYNGSDKFPYNYFLWQGMDGTEITSFLHLDYTSRTDPAAVQGRWDERVQKRKLNKFLLPFGYGDGGGGPTRDHIEYALREKDAENVPKVKMEAPQKFFDTLEKESPPVNKYVGELYFQCHRGTYTSVATVKKGNRKSEFALREAEIWAAASSIVSADKTKYPLKTLDKCWKDVLFNQFHDILPGSSIAEVYEEANQRYDNVFKDTTDIINESTASLTTGDGKTYFNSLSWERKALVKTENGYGYVTVPSMGWSSEINEDLPENPVYSKSDTDGILLSNGLISVKINCRGEITECFDSKGHRRISSHANALKLYKDVPRLYDAWDIDSMYTRQPVILNGESNIELSESNPFKSTVKVTRKISNSLWIQEITLEANKSKVDFDTYVNWNEKHKLLKVSFPTGIHAEDGINEMQFGYIKRPTHRSRPYDADRFEVCNHKYTALCDENRGAAVLNDCKYGVSMSGDEIVLTLLRASTSPILHCDKGEHRFKYSYYIWDGPMITSNVVREGYELNIPLTVSSGSAKASSLIQADAHNIITETVKCAEDGSGDIIIRLYECKHAATDTRLTLNFPVSRISLCDMLENETESLSLNNSKLSLYFRGFEIKTLRIKL